MKSVAAFLNSVIKIIRILRDRAVDTGVQRNDKSVSFSHHNSDTAKRVLPHSIFYLSAIVGRSQNLKP